MDPYKKTLSRPLIWKFANIFLRNFFLYYSDNVNEIFLLRILFVLILVLTNIASSCRSAREGVSDEAGAIGAAKVRETQEFLVRDAKQLLESSQNYLGEATSEAEKTAWKASIAAWDKALDMAHKAKKGRSDPNWDSDVWQSAHDAWEKAAAFRRPSREECERQRDELRRNQPPPEDGAVGGDMSCGEEFLRQGG